MISVALKKKKITITCICIHLSKVFQMKCVNHPLHYYVGPSHPYEKNCTIVCARGVIALKIVLKEF